MTPRLPRIALKLLSALIVLGGASAYLLLRRTSIDDGQEISISSNGHHDPIGAAMSAGNSTTARGEIPLSNGTAIGIDIVARRASVQLLNADTLTVSAGTSWRCLNSSAAISDEVALVTDHGGRLELAEGSWTIVSSDPWLWIEPGPHRIAAGVSLTLLVQDVGTLRVRTVDEVGAPVAGVGVQWIPGNARPTAASPESSVDVADRRNIVVSDEAGRAEFRSVPFRSGLLALVKEGWQYASVRLAAMTDAVVVVTLQRTDLDARELSIVEVLTELPIHELEVRTTGDVGVAHSKPGTNRIVLPGWARSEHTLSLRGRDVVPSSFRLAEVSSAVLGAYRPAYVRVLVRSDDVRLVTATVSADLETLRDDVAIAVPDIRTSYVLPVGVESTLELPAGVRLGLSAAADSGFASERSTFIATDGQLVELSLSNRDARTVAVIVDAHGAPIRGATTHVIGFGGRALEFRSDAAGQTRIAEGEPNASVTISATGYVTKSFSSLLALGAEGRITLLSASTVRARVITRSGTPLAGVELRGDQPWVRSTAGSGEEGAGSSTSGGALSALVTDADGRAEIVDAAKGALTIELTLPPAASSDEFGQSLFSLRRSLVVERDVEVVEWVVGAPRSVRIAAVDATTGRRLPTFSLAFADGSSAVRASGGIWSGWITDSLGDLIVSCPGVGEGRIAPADLDPMGINEIRLTWLPVFTITCIGLPIELADAKVTFEIFRRTDLGLVLVDRTQAQLNHSVATIEIPSLPGDLEVAVLMQGGLQGFVADPPFVPWSARGTAVIRFTRRN